MSWYEEAMLLEPASETERIVNFIRSEASELGRSGAVIGLSGGIDSAVVTALAARALGPKNVLALLMPERDSAKESVPDAVELAEKLGIEWQKINISSILKRIGSYDLYPWLAVITPRSLRKKFASTLLDEIAERSGELPFVASLKGGETPQLAVGNAYHRVKHRVRMVLTYFHAERLNRLVLGTSNYSEHITGYFVRYGDDTGDLSPIEHLFKMQVFKLAEYLGIPRAIIDKAPSPDLIPGVSDESALGMPYKKLDTIIAGLELGVAEAEVMAAAGASAADIENAKKMIRYSERKRHGPVCLPRRPLEPAAQPHA